MADLDNEDPRITYGPMAGGETVFNFPFLVYTDSGGGSSHLKFVRVRAGVTLLLTAGVHYTVSGLDAEAGGDATLVAAHAAIADDQYILYRELPIETFFSFATAGDYFAADVNKSNNLLLMILQQLRLAIARSAALDPQSVIDALQLPAPEALKYLRWNSGATALENADSGASVGTDQLVKVSSNDTNARYLLQKLLAGTGCTLVEGNDGGDETLTIAFATNPQLAGYTETVDLHGSAVVGAAETINASTANIHKILLDVNCTLTFDGAPAAGIAGGFTLYAVQDASGGNTITWPASVQWRGGSPPAQTTTGDAIDIYSFSTIDGGVTWQGFDGGRNFS